MIRAPGGGDADQRHADPQQAVAEPEDEGLRLRVAEHEGAEQQRQVDGRVKERDRLQAAEGDVAHSAGRRASRPAGRSGASASAGQRIDVGRPPGVGVVLGVGRDLRRPVGQPGETDQQHHLARQPHERLDGERSGTTDHSSSQLAGQGLGRVLVDLDRAAGAQRPAARPGGQPGGAAPGQPAAVGGPDHAQGRQALGGVLGHEPQRPAGRLELEREPIGPGLENRSAARRGRRGSGIRAGAAHRARRRPRR